MKKRIVCLLMAVCLIAAMVPLSVFAVTGSGTLDDPWVESTGVKAYLEKNVLHVYGAGDMPDYAAGAQPWYSKAANITSVVIEPEVTRIGARAFDCCTSLTSLTLKRDAAAVGALQLGQYAIPSGVSVTVEISGNSAMAEYDSNQPWANLKSRINSVVVDEGVQSVGKQAFSGCTNLTSVVIPSTVYVIGQEAFASCTSLTDVTLKHDFAAHTDLTIGADAFPTGNSGFKINMEITAGAMPDYASKDAQPWASLRPYIRTLTIHGGVTAIGANAFNACTGLTGITMYFTESGLTASKKLGADWLREASEVPISIVASSAAGNTFKTWGGGTFGNATASSTVLSYDRNGATVTATWITGDYGIVLSPDTNKDFGEVEPGYGAIDAYTLTVKNSGTKATDRLVIELSGGTTTAFTLSKKEISSLAVGASDTFTVVPKANLPLGEYTTTVAVSNDAHVVGSITITFIVSNDQSRAERFVKRVYRGALNREAEAEGLASWSAKLRSGVSAAEVAAGIFAGDEFRNRNLSNEDFIRALYRALLDRDVDASGMANWTGYLNAGYARSWVFKQIVDSAEFKAICARDTITPGTIDYTKYDMGNMNTVTTQAMAEAFVTRLYQVALGRSPDPDGLKTWSAQLTNRTSTGAVVAAGVFSSAEYVNKGVTNQIFVTHLYRALFDREPDASGMNTWTTYLANGQSRAWVFKMICASDEFKNLCATYNITPGTIDVNKFNMNYSSSSETATVVSETGAKAFIEHVYQSLLGRSCDVDGMADWSAKMISRTRSAAEVAAGIASSSEFANRHLSDEEYVKALYRALFNREVDTEGLNTWVNCLKAGNSRAWVFQKLCSNNEFKAYCTSLGINAGSISETAYNIG